MASYELTLSRRVYEIATVVVEADSEAQACELALAGDVVRDWRYACEDDAFEPEWIDIRLLDR